MSTKIKICFVLSHFSQGGAERQTLNLIQGIDKSVFDITLLIYGDIRIFYNEIYELPIHLVIRQSRFHRKLIKHINNAFFLWTFLKKGNYDILHTLLFHNGFWIRLLAPKKYNNRIIYSIRNNLVSCPKFLLFFEKLFIRKSYVVTNSLKSMYQFVQYVGENYKRRVAIIYNGIDAERFIVDEPLAIKKKIIIGAVGRQIAVKNHIQILQVINKIKDIYPIHFYLIGEASLDISAEINEFVAANSLENYVTILGSQSNIEEYYKLFHLFVLSSFHEGCPNVLFEAMFSKCLCIVSRGANTDHFVEDGYNGFVYNGANEMLESKLKQAIGFLLSGSANKIIHAGYKFAHKNFSLNKMVSSYEKLYDFALNS